MAEDWASDVKNYAPDADAATIAGIVRYCGIALRNRDSSLVSFSDPVETSLVRDNYCRKKLGLTDPDSVIDTAIAGVGERMSGDHTKNRVTVYYLLADHFGKLGVFAKAGVARASAGAGAGTGAAPIAGAVAATAATLAAGPAYADRGARAPVHAHPEAARQDDPGGFVGFGLAVLAGLAVIVVGTATLGSRIGSRGTPAAVASDPPADFSTPAATVPVPAQTIPDGAGVVAQEVAGKPIVSVYFDTAKTGIAPDFAKVVAPIKSWIDSHPGSRLAVSGFNDSRGNAAFNAELSKNRAKAVAAALAGTGVPPGVIDLEKPPETTDTGTDMTQARRVDIVVKDGG